MKKSLIVLVLSIFCLTLYANGVSTHKTYSKFTPAIQANTQKKRVVTHYVPVPVPGQLMPVKSALSQRYGKALHRLVGKPAVKHANKKATRQPRSQGYINSIMTYDYMPGALYQIYCAPLCVTDLEFQAGEKIISVAAGDTLRWQVSRTYSGSLVRHEHLLIKPIDAGLKNTLVVTTDRRTYHLILFSDTDTYMASVTWRYADSNDGFVQHFQSYPSKASPATTMPKGLHLSDLDFNYKASLVVGEKVPAWTPTMVFNDGAKTYIQFPSNMQDAPALFVGHGYGKERVVNYRVEGNYYIIDRVVKNMELRVGQSHPTVLSIKYQGKK